MARKMLRSYTILLYFLSIIAGFFLGLMYAGWTDAGKGQMLAAGAIVLGYGVLGSAIGLVTALAVAWWGNRRTIIGLNMVVALLVVGFFAYYKAKYQRRQRAEPIELPPATQVPLNKMNTIDMDDRPHPFSSDATSAADAVNLNDNQPSTSVMKSGQEIGLGLFAPDIMNRYPLYFYRQPITQWPPPPADIVDSITFHIDENNNPAITTAPPWLVPAHLKIDYGILFLKIITVYRHTLEVEVNNETGRTALIPNEPGRVVYWPEFILSVYSIELPDTGLQKIRVKPLDYAEEVTPSYSILRPVAIRANWVQVHLLDDDLDKKGEGWIKWREDGRLLVKYSLLS